MSKSPTRSVSTPVPPTQGVVTEAPAGKPAGAEGGKPVDLVAAAELIAAARFEPVKTADGFTRIPVQIDEAWLIQAETQALGELGGVMIVPAINMVALIKCYRELRPRLADALEAAVFGKIQERTQ